MPALDAVRRLLRAGDRPPPRPEHGPLLSVVVPVYGVASYLEATLANLAAQRYRDVEVIVVDDGSIDGSGEVARAFAERDPRFRVLRQDNAGPSAARNRGIAEARGDYLTFADGDDLLPRDAWSLLMGSLEHTGSDFAVGKIERDEGGRRWATARMEANHAVRRERQRVEDRPEILADVFPVNKVYRRTFWDELGLRFPEGLFYEDQPVMTVGFLRGTYDLLPETVYWYRVRADGSSTTQLRHEIADLRDRLETKRMTVRSILEDGRPQVRQVFFADVLPVDMWEYFRSVPRGTTEYWELLRDGVRELWNGETVPFELTVVPVQQRLMGWLTAADRREDLVTLIAWLDEHGPRQVEVDGVRVLDHPWREEPGLPLGCLRVEPVGP